LSETLHHAGAAHSSAAALAPVLTLDPADLASALDRLADPSALAAGLVNVIGLDGVAERFGSRWSLRRELVHEHVDRLLDRRLGAEAVFQRIGEVHYVVVQAGRTRLQAQSLCLGCMREILHHFTGEVRTRDLRLHEVTRVSEDEIVGHRVDVGAPGLAVRPASEEPRSFRPASPAPEDDVYPSPRSFAPTAPEAGSRSFAPVRPDPGSRSFAPRSPAPSAQASLLPVSQWTPFVASNGRPVKVSCSLEPVIKLANSEQIGFRLARRVLGAEGPMSVYELRNLSRADIARVDYATIARGLERLHADAGQDKSPTLVLPVSFATLSNQRTRETLTSLLLQAREGVRLGVVCEICELDGVPSSSVAAAVTLIAPFCLKVIAFATDPQPAVLKPLKGLGLAGVSVECPLNLGNAEFIGWARDAAKAVKPVANALVIYGVQPRERGALAALAGASHVSLAASATDGD
jgi:hypothetical protein